jgi:hypothetical protein
LERNSQLKGNGTTLIRYLTILLVAIGVACVVQPEHTPTLIPKSTPLSNPTSTPLAVPTVGPESTSTAKDKGIKMIISGRVVSGGDTTPEGLFDAPRKFVYEVETDENSPIQERRVYVTYTAYPPTPYGEAQREKIRLDFHEGRILPGHYVRASGTYDPDTKTLAVTEEGDFIEASREKPP